MTSCVYRRLRRGSVTALIVLLAAAVLQAQQARTSAPDVLKVIDMERGLSIEQLVALALDGSPSIQAARARVDAARGEGAQAALRPNPSLMSDWREQVGGGDRQTMIGLSVPLDLATRPGRVAVADSRIAVAEGELADVERRLAADVRSRAVALLGAARQLEVRERVAATLRQFTDLVAARAASGAAPPLERDIADVDARRAEADALRQRAAVEEALANLRRILGVPAEQPLALRETLDQLKGELQPIVQSGSSRPDVLLADERLHFATATVDLIRREAKLDVELTTSYMYMRSSYPLFGLDAAGSLKPIQGAFHNLSIGATVGLPWRDRRQGDLAAATGRVHEAEQTLEATRRSAAAEIQGAQARVRRLDAALDVYENGLRDLASRNVDVVRQSYELGRATLFDVLNETRRMLDTEMAYTDLLLEANQARFDLTTAMGAIR